MALDVEGVVDCGVSGEEPLGGGLGFEPLLLAFSSSDREMGVLNAVVFPQPTRPVQMPKIQLIKGHAVRRQTVGRDHLRLYRLIMQQASEKPQRRLCVPPALDYEVQDLALVIDGARQIHPPSADPADHLVQVPARRSPHRAAHRHSLNRERLAGVKSEPEVEMTSEEKLRLLAAYDRACLNAALANRGMYLLGNKPDLRRDRLRHSADSRTVRNLGADQQETPKPDPGSDDSGSNLTVS